MSLPANKSYLLLGSFMKRVNYTWGARDVALRRVRHAQAGTRRCRGPSCVARSTVGADGSSVPGYSPSL